MVIKKHLKNTMNNKNRRKAIYWLIFGLSLVIISFCIFFSLINHWTFKKINDKSIIRVNEITSIKEGLLISKKRAKTWKENVFLTNVILGFNGKDEIYSKKGTQKFRYMVINNDNFGYRYGECWIEISMKQNAIVNFEASGGDKLWGNVIHPDKWNMDLEELFDLIQKTQFYEIIDTLNNPRVVINAGDKRWYIRVYEIPFSKDEIIHPKLLEIEIDPIEKEIISFDN